MNELIFNEELTAQGEETKGIKKSNKIFISHSTKDKAYAEVIVDLLRSLGLNQNHIFCSSYPGFGVKNGENINDFLHKQFKSYEVFFISIHSGNYNSSIVAQNEVGAAWYSVSKRISFLVPGFSFEEMRGVIGNAEVAIKLDSDIRDVKDRLNQLRDAITDIFHLDRLVDSAWEKSRDDFLEKVKRIDSEKFDNNAESADAIFNLKNKFFAATQATDRHTVSFGFYPQSYASIDTSIRLQDKGNNIFLNPVTGERFLKLPKNNLTSVAKNFIFSDGTEIKKVQRRVSYFKIEPIEWIVLENDGYASLLLSKKILDWNHFLEHRFVKPQGNMYLTTYGDYDDGARANNWKYSSLRNWLNTEFLNSAFDGNQRRSILTEETDNSRQSGCLEEESEIKKFCCSNTEDRVFILSYADVINSSYGFDRNPSKKDDFRIAEVTDYSIARGVNPSIENGRLVGWWWLRSPADYRKYYMFQYPNGYHELLDDDEKEQKAKRCAQLRVCDVMSDGHVCTRGSIVDGRTFIEEIEGDCDGTANGVRIAIRVKNKYWNSNDV